MCLQLYLYVVTSLQNICNNLSVKYSVVTRGQTTGRIEVRFEIIFFFSRFFVLSGRTLFLQTE